MENAKAFNLITIIKQSLNKNFEIINMEVVIVVRVITFNKKVTVNITKLKKIRELGWNYHLSSWLKKKDKRR